MKWRKAKLAGLFRVKHGFAFKSEFFDSAGPYALLTPGNFHETGGFRERGEKQPYFTGEVPPAYILDEGDLIVAMTEQEHGLLGSSAWVPESNRYLHNQRLGRIVDLDAERLHKRFLYYLFNTREVRAQISGSASGTKVRHTAPERIGRVEVNLPPLGEQQRIADVLTAYDELMENNRRRMALLEDSARQLYAEWFVRLRYPNHGRARRPDVLPKGWTRRPLEEICAEVRDAATPDECEPDLPYIGLEHIPRRSISLREWGRAEEVTSTKHRFIPGDILFGKIRPYFHKVGVAFVDGVASSDAIVLRPTSAELHSFALLTVSSDWFVAEASKTAREGSKMPRADWKLMKQRQIAVPPDALLRAFNAHIEPIVAQLKTLTFQTQKLRTTRDLLLPRLMSGELTV